MLIPRQTNRLKRALTCICMAVTYKCRLLGLSPLILWPTLLTCSVTATSLSFLEVFGLPTLFELSCQLISKVQPGPMTCVSCLIGLRYVEPLSSFISYPFVFFISSLRCFFHAMHVIHPCSSRRCPLSGTIEACATRLCSHTFTVGLILEPREGWRLRHHRC